MTEEKLAKIDEPEDPIFTPRERAVLQFVSTMVRNAADEADARFDAMREHFDEPALVEIGFAVATLAGMNLFNNMFGIEPEPEPMVSNTGVRDA